MNIFAILFLRNRYKIAQILLITSEYSHHLFAGHIATVCFCLIEEIEHVI
jgi:hypothetical protein